MLIEQMAVLTTGLIFIMFFIIEWWRMGESSQDCHITVTEMSW